MSNEVSREVSGDSDIHATQPKIRHKIQHVVSNDDFFCSYQGGLEGCQNYGFRRIRGGDGIEPIREPGQ